MQLTLKDLDLKSGSPRKVVANVELKQLLDLAHFSLERKLTINTLHQRLTALIHARESGEIEVTLPELKVSAAALRASAGGNQLKPLPLTAVVTAAGIRLGPVKGARPVVEGATCVLAGGDFLQFSAKGALSGGSSQVVSTDGTATVDFGRILPLAAPFLPKGVTAGGTGSIAWSLSAPAARQAVP